jgi:predicted metalloendopeptidase
VDLQALGLDDHELDFLMDDLGEMDLDAISKALDEEVDQQDKDTADKVTATDASEERLGKVFGFNAIPIAAVKDVRRLIADMESETKKTGQDAFVEWCRARV